MSLSVRSEAFEPNFGRIDAARFVGFIPEYLKMDGCFVLLRTDRIRRCGRLDSGRSHLRFFSVRPLSEM